MPVFNATDPQHETVSALERMSAAASPSGKPETIETHAAIVFLVGETALKLKKARDLGYLDFSTLEARQKACQAEIELNRPNAPNLYLDVIEVVRRPDGTVAIATAGGEPSAPAVPGLPHGHPDGDVIDYVVRMRRFDQQDLFSEMAKRQALTPDLLVRATRMILAMHAQAKPSDDPAAATHVAMVETDIANALSRPGCRLDSGEVARFRKAAEDAIAAQRPVILARLEAGWVRRCHGDLHLRNLVLDRGEPVAFDALEFDEDLATIDVLDDLAFLLMDLAANHDRPGANLVLNTYLSESGSAEHLGALGLVPLFMSLRAGVRARVALDREPHAPASPSGPAETSPAAEAQRYLSLAGDLIAPEPARLYAVGGLSGTGKSTLARTIAGHLGKRIGAIHLRTDVVRKQLAGVPLSQRLPSTAYSPEASQRVYRAVLDHAQTVLAAGLPVIVDAVFGTQDERDTLARTAAESGVPLRCVWLTADPETLTARVAHRSGDASDATVDVVERQVSTLAPPTDWPHVDAAGPLKQTAARVLDVWQVVRS